MGRRFDGRDKARERAVQALYGHSFQKEGGEAGLRASFLTAPANRCSREGGNSLGIDPYAWRLAAGVAAHEKELDAAIAPHLRGWSLERLGRLELILLRMGLFEVTGMGAPGRRVLFSVGNLASLLGIGAARAFITGVLEAALAAAANKR